jgi:hypothetical protein
MGVLQLLALIMLGIGVSRIRSLIVQNDSSEMNNRNLLLHLVCFILYLLTLFFIAYRMVSSALEQRENIDATLYLATLSNVVFFFMMGALLAILYSLGTRIQIDYVETPSSFVSNIQTI